MAQNANRLASSQAEEITQGAAQNANVAAVDQAEEIIQRLENAANNAAAVVALSPIQRVLHTIVVLTRTQCVAVVSDGYKDFMDFENIQWDSIEKWISSAINSNLNKGEFILSHAKEKRIQALELWVNVSLHIRRVKFEADFDDTEFAIIEMNEMVNDSYIQ